MESYHSELDILHQSDFGYVGECPCCGEIQFSIGSIVSHMNETGFSSLHSAMLELKKNIEKRVVKMPNGERVLLRTPADDILLSLTREEYHQTLDLFGQASLMKNVKQLLKPTEI